jgi:hypothetical protein
MARVALGQGKMFTRPLAAVMHLILYAGFIIINIELLEIVLDGITGHHRLFSFLGGFYDFLIASFEILALLVLVACVVFLSRRNVMRIKRFWMREMTSWPRTDANLILVAEILLMSAFLTMNACDALLQTRGAEHYVEAGSFPVSQMLFPMLENFSSDGLILIERSCWWFHIIGILAFIVYHLLHFTVRVGNQYNNSSLYSYDLHGHTVHNVYKMVIDGFSWAPAAIFYVIAMLLLSSHLSHGFSSLFQTLGLSTHRTEPLFKKLGHAFALLILVGNCSIPIAILVFGYGR